MKRMMVCLIASFLLIGVSAASLKVHADYSGDINIFSDGSVGPSDAPMSTVDNITYVLTENLIGRIFIYRDNITLDGSAHIIKPPAIPGPHLTGGIRADGIKNLTIMNCNVSSFNWGMLFLSCSNLTIRGNNLTDNLNGISLLLTNNVVISGNTLKLDHAEGIGAESSNYLNIFNNSISESLNCVALGNCNSSTIETNKMINNLFSVEISHSYDNSVMKNEIVGNMTNHGVWLDSSSNNVVANNNVSENNEGFSLFNASGNMITGNNIENNTIGIDFNNSTDNNVYHNNFLNNNQTVTIEDSYPNFLDSGIEGNYWSDYNGTDNNQDGIGDTPYVIDANNTDHYPLMGTFQTFNFSSFYYPVERFEEVDIISNSTIGNVDRWYVDDVHSPTGGDWFLSLTGVTGQNGTAGFCRITFPNIMMNSSSYPVYLGNEFTTPQISSRTLMSNGTHTTLYFTYVHPVPYSTIDVFPEFPSFLILPLFFITTLLAITFYRKRRAK